MSTFCVMNSVSPCRFLVRPHLPESRNTYMAACQWRVRGLSVLGPVVVSCSVLLSVVLSP